MLAHGREQQRELKGLSPTKGSRIAVSETLVYLFSYSLPNQYQKQQKKKQKKNAGTRRKKKKTHAKANKCLFSGGRELERGAISSSYLSLSALALNECSSTLGHITFVLYKSL